MPYFRSSFSALGNICQMIGKSWLRLCDHKWNVSRILILLSSPVLVYVGLVLDMNKTLPFACGWLLTYCVCVCDRAQSMFKELKLESDFSLLCYSATNGSSPPPVFLLFLQDLFKQHALRLTMSPGSFIPGDSFHPPLALAPFLVGFRWAAAGSRAWQACVCGSFNRTTWRNPRWFS